MPDAARMSLAEILPASVGYAGFVAILFVGSLLLTFGIGGRSSA